MTSCTRIRNAILKFVLKNRQRYKTGQTYLTGKKIKYVDNMSLLFSYQEIFDRHVYGFICNNEKPLIIDCGSNIGLSILYFKSLYKEAKVIGFEPDEKIFKLLEYNIYESHSLKDVTLINKALWTVKGTRSFITEGADASRVTNEITSQKVYTDTLSNYLQTKIDYLKMDIEGAEWNVLQECGDRLRNVQQMFIEYHSYIQRNNNLHLILELLSDLNFRYYLSTPGLNSRNPLIKPILYAGMDMQVNIFAKNQS